MSDLHPGQSSGLYRMVIHDYTDDETGLPDRMIGMVAVDWRQALHDALLSVNVNSSKVATEFERLVTDPAYEAGE